MRTIEAECVWCGCGLDRHDDDGSCVMLPANPTYSPALPRPATVPDEVVKALHSSGMALASGNKAAAKMALEDVNTALQTIKGNGQ